MVSEASEPLPSTEGDPLSVFAAAREQPGEPALIVGGEVLTWQRLAEQVVAALEALERSGLAAEQPIALVGRSEPATLVRLYALLERQTPVVLLHPRSPEAEQRAFLADCGQPPRWHPGEDRPRGGPSHTAFLAHLKGLQTPGMEPSPPVVVVRTSGSSGGPKGVVLSRRALLTAAAASAANLGWQSDDRWLLSLPIAHVGGLSIVTRCLAARRTVVVEPGARFVAEQVAQQIVDRRVTLVSLVPTTLRRLLALDDWNPPRHLRALLVGGAPTAPEVLVEARRRGWPVLTTYGCTEACSQIATQRPGVSTDTANTGCGPPLPGLTLRVRQGAIEVRGPMLMSGYLPPQPGTWTEDGFFRTGDLGQLETPDAAGARQAVLTLRVLGRRDAVILSGGENVHPAEVEAVLSGLPGVSAAVVFGVDDAEWGQVVAVVLEISSPSPAASGAMTSLQGDRWSTLWRQSLAPHQRPRHVVPISALPRTPLGKVDRRRTLAWARAWLDAAAVGG